MTRPWTCKGPSEILSFAKVPLVANAHPLQVDPGIGLLCALEGFSFVGGRSLPDNPFVGSRAVLGSRARDGFDIAADQRNDLPVGHVAVNVPCGVFYQSRERHAAGPERSRLFLGRPERTWLTLHWYWDHQVSPGLRTWWEGSGEENTFHLWEQVRGWLKPPYVTPHYWTGAEMLLLQVDMLAYVDESKGGAPSLVVGAGIPPDWCSHSMSVRGLPTRLGKIDWVWEGGQMAVTVHGLHCAVRLGPSFPSNTPLRVEYAVGR